MAEATFKRGTSWLPCHSYYYTTCAFVQDALGLYQPCASEQELLHSLQLSACGEFSIKPQDILPKWHLTKTTNATNSAWNSPDGNSASRTLNPNRLHSTREVRNLLVKHLLCRGYQHILLKGRLDSSLSEPVLAQSGPLLHAYISMVAFVPAILSQFYYCLIQDLDMIFTTWLFWFFFCKAT